VILDTYANTSSAGSIIAFHSYQDDLPSGAMHGVICSFGAGIRSAAWWCVRQRRGRQVARKHLRRRMPRQ
jgi:3-oxoacyl-[acyl-carrier-protein] synthase III